jgi:hypothetical protein
MRLAFIVTAEFRRIADLVEGADCSTCLSLANRNLHRSKRLLVIDQLRGVCRHQSFRRSLSPADRAHNNLAVLASQPFAQNIFPHALHTLRNAPQTQYPRGPSGTSLSESPERKWGSAGEKRASLGGLPCSESDVLAALFALPPLHFCSANLIPSRLRIKLKRFGGDPSPRKVPQSTLRGLVAQPGQAQTSRGTSGAPQSTSRAPPERVEATPCLWRDCFGAELGHAGRFSHANTKALARLMPRRCHSRPLMHRLAGHTHSLKRPLLGRIRPKRTNKYRRFARTAISA